MPYVALEWDHKIGRPVIQWLVVKCQSVGQKFGGPQALPPRRDVAYFVDEETAERDAKAFAAYKTRQDNGQTAASNAGKSEALQQAPRRLRLGPQHLQSARAVGRAGVERREPGRRELPQRRRLLPRSRDGRGGRPRVPRPPRRAGGRQVQSRVVKLGSHLEN